MNDDELVFSFQHGNAAAGEELLKRYKGAVANTARQYFVSGSDGDDVIQIAMIGLYKAMENYDGGGSFAAYAKTAVRNAILTEVKNSNRMKRKSDSVSVPLEDESVSLVLSRSDDPEERLISREGVDNIEIAIEENLSDFEKKILQMLLCGSTYAEIAENLEKDVKAVDNAVQRIRKKLARALSV